jgi:putative DNA primase/helicase
VNWKIKYPECNVGIVLSTKLVAIDIDVMNQKCANAILKEVVNRFGTDVLVRQGKQPKLLVLFKTQDDEIIKKHKIHLKDGLGEIHQVEILADGNQFIAFGTHPDTQREYNWISMRTPINTVVDELPSISLAEIRDFLLNLYKILPGGWAVEKIDGLNKLAPQNAIKNELVSVKNNHFVNQNTHVDELKAHLDNIDADDYDTWVSVGMALNDYDAEQGLQLWEDWSQKSSNYKKNDCINKWPTFKSGGLTIGTIIDLSKKSMLKKYESRIAQCTDSSELLTRDLLDIKACNFKFEDYKKLTLLIEQKSQELGKKLTKNDKKSFDIIIDSKYEVNEHGLFYHTQKNGEPYSYRISSPIFVEAISLDGLGSNYGRYLKFQTRLGEWKNIYIPMTILADKSFALQRELLNEGCDIDFDRYQDLNRYISTADTDKVVEISTKNGWMSNDCFVMPHKTIGEQNIFYQGFQSNNPYSEHGSIEDWRQQISEYCRGNTMLMFSISTALAAPLLKMSGIPNGGGFHFFGASSKGKSTLSLITASLYGKPLDFMKSWRTTTNALEATAEQYNDCVLVLDEISQSDGRDLGNAIYTLANGKGKARSDRNGAAKNIKKWQIMMMSNGERSIDSHCESDKSPVGQMIRLLNIPIFGQYGVFNELHDKKDGREFSEYLSHTCQNNYGTAGILWLEKLIKNKPEIKVLLDEMTNHFIKKATKAKLGKLSSQHLRAIKLFALVALAGELSGIYGVTTWEKDESINAAFECFMQWKKYHGNTEGDIEQTQILRLIKNYVDLHGNSRFQEVANAGLDGKSIYMQAGYKRWAGEEKGYIYLFNRTALQEALSGHDFSFGIRTLIEQRWLTPASDRPDTQHRINKQQKRFYQITIDDI